MWRFIVWALLLSTGAIVGCLVAVVGYVPLFLALNIQSIRARRDIIALACWSVIWGGWLAGIGGMAAGASLGGLAAAKLCHVMEN